MRNQSGIKHCLDIVFTLYTGAYGESWSPRCLLVSVDLLAALGAIRAAQRQSAKNFLQILVLLK